MQTKLNLYKCSINFKNPLVATTSIADPFGYQLPSHHVDKSLLTVQKQITAKQVLEIGVHIDTNTEERYGAIKVLLHGTDKKQWVLLETFLKGRKDRTYIHYNLLTQFLDNTSSIDRTCFTLYLSDQMLKSQIKKGRASLIQLGPE